MKKSNPPPDDLPKLSAPSRAAFALAGYTRLEDFTKVTEKEILKLHGVGPNAIEQLRRALAAKGLSFAEPKRGKG